MTTDYLTGAEVCALLRVHRTYLPRLVADGMPHVRIGNRVRVRRADLDAWWASRIVSAGGGGDGEVRRRQPVPAAGRPVVRQGAERTRRVPLRDRDGRARGTGPVEGVAEVGPEDYVPARRRARP